MVGNDNIKLCNDEEAEIMPDYFPFIALSIPVVRLILLAVILPKNARLLRETRGGLWSNIFLGVVIFGIAAVVFTTPLPLEKYFIAITLPSVCFIIGLQGFLEWFFAKQSKEYIVTIILGVYTIAALLITSFIIG